MDGDTLARFQVAEFKYLILLCFVLHIEIVKPIMLLASKPKKHDRSPEKRLTTAGVQTRPLPEKRKPHERKSRHTYPQAP
jgi:hypothetical protein